MVVWAWVFHCSLLGCIIKPEEGHEKYFTMQEIKYFCQCCERELDSGERPCPSCGCRKIRIEASFSETVGIVDRLSSRARLRGKGYKKFWKEIIQGRFPSRNKKRHPAGVEKVRVIDKQADEYREVVRDGKTGKVTRDVHEQLSQHQQRTKRDE